MILAVRRYSIRRDCLRGLPRDRPGVIGVGLGVRDMEFHFTQACPHINNARPDFAAKAGAPRGYLTAANSLCAVAMGMNCRAERADFTTRCPAPPTAR